MSEKPLMSNGKAVTIRVVQLTRMIQKLMRNENALEKIDAMEDVFAKDPNCRFHTWMGCQA